MKNEDLIAILRELPSDAELAVEVSDIATGNILGNTYDIGYDVNEYGELKLTVAVETRQAQDKKRENRSGKYEYVVQGVEDLDGTSPYRITSTEPLSKQLIDYFRKDYVSISMLEFYSLQYNFKFKAIDLEEEDIF